MATNFSVCIIAKNEEKYIETCLQALKTFDVEVVVVDTGSTDHTKDIVKKYTNNLYDFEWIGDFSAARNFAAKCAKNNIILALDCDEFIERLNIKQIQEILKKNPYSIGMLSLLNYVSSGTTAARYSTKVARIYDKRFVHFEDRIHEQLRAKNGQKLDYTDVEASALHMGYMTSEEERYRKNMRNIELLLLQAEEKTNDAYTYYQLGQSYDAIKDEENAYEARKKAMSLKPGKNDDFTSSLLVGYIKSALQAGDYSDALIAKEYYETFKNDADYLFHLGQVCYANGQIEEALNIFEKATKAPAGRIEGTNSFFPLNAMSLLYEKLGETEKAKEFSDKAQEFLKKAYNM